MSEGIDFNCGVSIDEKQFMKLSIKQQNCVLFQNMKEIKKEIPSIQLHQKIQYGTLAILTSITFFVLTRVV